MYTGQQKLFIVKGSFYNLYFYLKLLKAFIVTNNQATKVLELTNILHVPIQ